MRLTLEQTTALRALGILDTAEVVNFLSNLIRGVHTAREDGKISLIEAAKLAWSLHSEATVALDNIILVPAEIKSIATQPDRVADLADILFPAFSGFPSQARDQVSAILALIIALSHASAVFLNPPKAHPVP